MKLATVVAKYVLLRRSIGMRFISQAKELKGFCRVMGDIDITAVKSEAVNIYLRGKGRLTSSWHQKHSTLKSFYRFAIGRGFATTSPLPTTIPRHPPTFTPYIYSLENLHRILDAAKALDFRHPKNGQHHGFSTLTFRTLILLLYGAGLRLSEALSLRLADVDLPNAVLTVHEGKFFKERLVPFSHRLAVEMDIYAKQRRRRSHPLDQESPFFIKRDGRALNKSSVQYAWQKLREAAGVRSPDGASEQPRLHDLRHTFAVHRLVSWYRQGADVQRLIYFLQIYLGHEKLAYTQRYLTMTPELLGQANERFANYVSTEVERD